MTTFHTGAIPHLSHAEWDGYFPVPGAVLKTVVLPPAMAPAAHIVLPADASAAQREVSGMMGCYAGPVSELGFYLASDLRVAGRGLFKADGALLVEPDLMPQYVRDMVTAGQRDYELGGSQRPVRRIDGTVLVLTAEAHLVYGHWLVDYYPKAWLYARHFGQAGRRPKLLLPHDTPGYARRVLTEYFGADFEVVTWDWYVEELSLEHAIVPSMLHNSHLFHPAMNRFVADVSATAERLGGGEALPAGSRLFLSRRQHQNESMFKRSLVNEDEIVAVLRARGFDVVVPETLPWHEQIRLFRNASVIAGESGSALHNAIFAGSRAAVLCIRPAGQVQATVAALRGQRIGFVTADHEQSGEDGGTQYAVDAAQVNDMLDALLLPTGVPAG